MSEELSFYKSEVQRLRVELAQTKELVSLREVQISNLLTIVERCVFLIFTIPSFNFLSD